MNTHKTSKSKRWKPTKGTSISFPSGAHFGITSTAIAVQYSLLVTYWPHVEEMMVNFFDELIAGNPRSSYPMDLSARQIFRSVVSQEARIKMMRSLLETSPHNVAKPSSYDEILDEYERLNKLRNGYVHGIWHTDARGANVTIAKATAQGFAYSPASIVREKTLSDVIGRMRALFQKIALRNKPNVTRP